MVAFGIRLRPHTTTTPTTPTTHELRVHTGRCSIHNIYEPTTCQNKCVGLRYLLKSNITEAFVQIAYTRKAQEKLWHNKAEKQSKRDHEKELRKEYMDLARTKKCRDELNKIHTKFPWHIGMLDYYNIRK